MTPKIGLKLIFSSITRTVSYHLSNVERKEIITVIGPAVISIIGSIFVVYDLFVSGASLQNIN